MPKPTPLSKPFLPRAVAGLLLVSTSLANVACAATDALESSTATPWDETILIFFDSDKCPVGVNIYELSATRENPPTRITWKDAGLTASPPTADPAEFKVIFSPFVGNPIVGNNGQTAPKVIISDMPRVKFKYTIVGTACPDESRDHLDPFIRII